VKITYEDPQEGKTVCNVYPVISFDVQKPELVTKWLSPEQINKSIQAIDSVIEIGEKLLKVVEKATKVAIVACGLLVIWQYLKGFGKQQKVKEEGSECTESQQDMKTVYWVCDRILCPAAPPKCGEFTYEGEGSTDAYEQQYETNQNYLDSYNQMKNAGEDPIYGQKNFEECMKDTTCSAGVKSNCGAACQDNEYQYQTAAFSFKNNQGQNYNMEFFYVDANSKKITDPNYEGAHTFETVEGNRVQIKNDLDAMASQCAGGTIVRTRTTTTSGEEGVFTGKKRIGQYDYECLKGPGFEDYEQPNTPPPDASRIKGCYNKECPQFDNTKCFDKDDINPPGGLWSSGMCVCLPGLQSHIKNYLKILNGAKKCLQQALIGEVRGGFCERLLAQFICDLLTEAFRYIFKSAGGGVSGAAGGARSALGNYKENSQAVSDSLSDRYGGVVNNRL
jgi:hypothetical protein